MQKGCFVITDADVGFTLNGTNYTFEHIDNVTIDDPQLKHLTRGANASSKSGLMYTEGQSSPKVLTFTLKGASVAHLNLLKDHYAEQSEDERIDFWVIDRKTGSIMSAKDAILQKEPRQASISEGEDNLNIDVMIETFNLTDNVKE